MYSTDQSFLSSQPRIVDSVKRTTILRSRTTSRIDKKLSDHNSQSKESDQDIRRFKQEMVELQKKNRKKFDYLIQIPFVINDPKILSRKITLQTFSSCAQSGLFKEQQKKASALANTISQKSDSKSIIGSISKVKTTDSKNDTEKSLMKCNELWSKVYNNQVFRQSRLQQLSSALTMKKINMSQEEQLYEFSKFFQKHHKQTKGTIPELVNKIETAFGVNGSPIRNRKRKYNQSIFSNIQQSDQSQFDNTSDDSQQIKGIENVVKFPIHKPKLYQRNSTQNNSEIKISRFHRSISQKLITLQNKSKEEIEDCANFDKKLQRFLNQDEIKSKNRMISYFQKRDQDNLKEILRRQHSICDNIHIKKRKQDLQIEI